MATRKPRRATRSAPPARARAKTRARTRPVARQATAQPIAEQRRHTPETLRLRTFEPSLTVSDLERSLRFYREVLGFFVGQQWRDQATGKLLGVMLKAGACQLGLSQDDWAKGRDRKRGEGVRIWCTTAQDIDALAARIKAAGVPLTEEPTDQAWGGRSLSVDDPDGFHLSIYRAPEPARQ